MTILMTEEAWMSSPLSIARHYGGVNIKGIEYSIVDKRGHTLLECSLEAEKAGRDKAIMPGEPADLLRNDFIKFYRKLGRDTFISILEKNRCEDEKALKKIYREACAACNKKQ